MMMIFWNISVTFLLILFGLFYFVKYKISFNLLVENKIKLDKFEKTLKNQEQQIEEAKLYLEHYIIIKAENNERKSYIEHINSILIENKQLVEKLLIFIIQRNYKGEPEEYKKKFNNLVLTSVNIDELLVFIDKSELKPVKKNKKTKQLLVLDEILDKVKNNGVNSLTDDEKIFLNNFDTE
jgi:hypothetical protein